jgi:adenine-specific DNA-methyltransferase
MTTQAARIADPASARKARGAFFTPPLLARYVVDWAIHTPGDDVLEPSCGEAAFLLAATGRLDALGAGADGSKGRLDGVELHPDSAAAAECLLAATGHQASVTVGDFFLVEPRARYDAVVGNPPYIRYQDFSGKARTGSRKAAFQAGVSLTNLASSWAAFTVHSALFLKPGGRLGLVIPAELMSVNYASEVRRFLMERFAHVSLVMFTERVFPQVLEEVVLVLAGGFDRGPSAHFELHQARNVEDLIGQTSLSRSWKPEPLDAKWTPSLMSTAALEVYVGLEAAGDFATLHAWGETTLGMVTGNNRYFALSPERARELGLAGDELIAVSPPGSRHLRGLVFTTAAYDRLARDGSSTLLFRPPGARLSTAAKAYIAAGEKLGVDRAYKCRVRTPWWRVPLVPPADLLLTYMNADTPRLTANRKRAHHLNSVHGVYVRAGLTKLAMDLLPLASINSMTLLGAETVGRAYGGGMLKLEPKEADKLPVPSPEVLRASQDALAAIRRQVAAGLRRPAGLLEAAKLVDDVLLVGTLGIPRSEVKALRGAHAELTARRLARGSVPGSQVFRG